MLPELHSDRIDRVVLHPVAGPLLLAVLAVCGLPGRVQLVGGPDGCHQGGHRVAGPRRAATLPNQGAWHWLNSLVVDGVIAGVGGVLVFLPQIVILFFFILVLEESGYLPRAAFLLDRLMGAWA
jgi:ferrous iron transport protein B